MQLEVERVRAEAAELSHALESALSAPLQSARGLVATLETEPDMEQRRFEELVADTFTPDMGVRNVAAARDLVINLIAPTQGNEAALGLDYRTNAPQRVDVLTVQASGQFLLAGPVDLVQGGQGFIGRFPVVDQTGETPVFWGILSVVIDVPTLFANAGLADPGPSLDIALVASRDDAGRAPLFGSPDLPGRDPIAVTVSFPNGYWTLLAAPVGGWGSTVTVAMFRVVLGIIGFVIVFLTIMARQFSDGKSATIARLHRKRIELERAHRALERVSLHDDLTGLPNRLHLKQELMRRIPTRRQGLVLLDLDRFHDINQSHGQQTGDTILSQVADRLRQAIGPDHFAARIGGDEFAVLCCCGGDEPMTAEQMYGIVEAFVVEILETMKAPFWAEGSKHSIGVSAGIELICRQSDRSSDNILIRASDALRNAKQQGRSRYHFAPPINPAPQRIEITSDAFIDALADRQIVAHYQPQFDRSGAVIVGLEALARWPHPVFGFCPPGRFLGIASHLKIENELDYAIMSSDAEDIRGWKAANINVPPIALNLSARTLSDPDLLERLADLGLGPEEIKIELLESIDLDRARDTVGNNLDALKAEGFRIEIDDFGTGYSSITSLLRVRPDCLKIDRSIVQAKTGEGNSPGLLALIVEMGHALDTEVCAEGIGSAAQLRQAQQANCNILQGYFLGVPANSETTAQLLAATGTLARSPRRGQAATQSA